MSDTETAAEAKESKSVKVAFPDREDDGCTHCDMILSVYNERTGELNVEASEAAQAAHAANVGCPATPNFTDPNAVRKVDKKTGKLDGEYAPAWSK